MSPVKVKSTKLCSCSIGRVYPQGAQTICVSKFEGFVWDIDNFEVYIQIEILAGAHWVPDIG